MHFIDTHAHIYLPEFDGTRSEEIAAAEAKGISNILMPAIDRTTHEQMLEVEDGEGVCRPMMGLHPCSVKADFENELTAVQEWLQQRHFIAVGEIGLDFYWDTTFKAQQYTAFHRQIGWALERDLPIVIHSRNATQECLEVVQQYPGLRGVFHCFSGSAEQAAGIVACGFCLGIGGVLTFKNAGLDRAIEAISLEHLVLETDAPYLAPVPFRGKQNRPSYLTLVAERLALLKGVTVEEIARVTTANAIKLFQLS